MTIEGIVFRRTAGNVEGCRECGEAVPLVDLEAGRALLTSVALLCARCHGRHVAPFVSALHAQAVTP